MNDLPKRFGHVLRRTYTVGLPETAHSRLRADETVSISYVKRMSDDRRASICPTPIASRLPLVADRLRRPLPLLREPLRAG